MVKFCGKPLPPPPLLSLLHSQNLFNLKLFCVNTSIFLRQEFQKGGGGTRATKIATASGRGLKSCNSAI